jgi:transcription factor E2F3
LFAILNDSCINKSVTLLQLKRKATSEENDAAAEPSDCIITSPMPTSVSGKTVKASKAKAKNSKTGPQTPSSNVGECKHW